jgi:hypothetical protein
MLFALTSPYANDFCVEASFALKLDDSQDWLPPRILIYV